MKTSFLRLVAAAVLGVMLAFCRPQSPTGPGLVPAPPPGEMAPTPYTAEELRASNPPGTLYRYKVEVAGQPVRIHEMEFASGSSVQTAEVKNRLLDETGREVEPSKVQNTAWEDLRRHAQFPKDALTVERGSIEVPAGRFETDVYTVRGPNGETMRYYFAKSYAGPPVLFYQERRGIRGMTTTLLERKVPGSADAGATE